MNENIETLDLTATSPATPHKDAVKILNVDWEKENTGSIFVKTDFKHGVAIAVEKYPIDLWDKKFRSQMAKKYKKFNKKNSLSVMISHNQSEFDALSGQIADYHDSEEKN